MPLRPATCLQVGSKSLLFARPLLKCSAGSATRFASTASYGRRPVCWDAPGLRAPGTPPRRHFSATRPRLEIFDVSALPDRIIPKYQESAASSLLLLHWPQPPRNILLIPKLHAPQVTLSAVAFAKHLHSNYPDLNLVFESRIASAIHESLPFPIYTTSGGDPSLQFPNKIDLVTTLGGDGTILRAASLFSLQASVPPILSFSMGSVGFLGEWKFEEYKRAWREVYMSGSGVAVEDLYAPHTETAAGVLGNGFSSPTPTVSRIGEDASPHPPSGWEGHTGRSMGPSRTSKILLRHRLKVGVYDEHGVNINNQLMPTSTAEPRHDHDDPRDESATRPPPSSASPYPSPTYGRATPAGIHAINELLIHRGPHPHLAIIDIYLNNHFLTEAVADGILISTPTGSTAYSLSAGGSIIHPLVGSLLITPICPRSLSFRPLVLPLNTKVTLRLSDRNRGRELEVSIDGKRRAGVGIGMEVHVEGETVGRSTDGSWRGGVPCVIRAPGKADVQGISDDDDGWVGGLNGLLKFNYPFGEAGH
ncbi:NADH kinase POS5 [Magnaporthiopsis poae ATCC 64411]|uniref:NADH kinase POS5 n=1 Tax=Magnaporthiopsis poae (strain ATCC 64411 / 73-15) TaxID=644358 RepID=A0A0C4DXH1_MAGP6|nr:NADH kinase POS5 [Magnaporthiopsis poae ATCC 64411]